MMQDPDRGLVHEAKAGSRNAFAKLVDHYYEMVYGLAFGVLADREAARDVAQDVFLKAFREIAGFEEKSRFKTWLYRIAMNAAIDQVRKKRPHEVIDLTDASGEDEKAPLVIADPSRGPRDQIQHEELKALFEKALEGLTPEHKAILALREWQEMSYEEIAEVLGIEIGTVMSRLYYARKKLSEILSQKYGRGIL